MSSRQIIYLKEGKIKKIIPDFPEINSKIFPSFGEIYDNYDKAKELIYKNLKNASLTCQAAVIQQYNEWYVYDSVDEELKSILAPITGLSSDARHLPILEMPLFTPLADDKAFYKYSDEESLIELGRVSERKNIDFLNIKNFLKKIRTLCDEFSLREEDIIYNLSNIGYNSDYGFRVIDYGLNFESKEIFELIW